MQLCSLNGGPSLLQVAYRLWWTRATARSSRCNKPTLATVLLLGPAAGGLAPQAMADERPAATVALGTERSLNRFPRPYPSTAPQAGGLLK